MLFCQLAGTGQVESDDIRHHLESVGMMILTQNAAINVMDGAADDCCSRICIIIPRVCVGMSFADNESIRI